MSELAALDSGVLGAGSNSAKGAIIFAVASILLSLLLLALGGFL